MINSTSLAVSPEDNINFNGKDWHTLKTFLQMMLENSVSQLCGDKPIEDTQKLRGQILCLKTILDLETSARQKAGPTLSQGNPYDYGKY